MSLRDNDLLQIWVKKALRNSRSCFSRILQTCEQLEKWGTWSISDNDNREKLWEDVDDTPECGLKTDRGIFLCEQMEIHKWARWRAYICVHVCVVVSNRVFFLCVKYPNWLQPHRTLEGGV